MIRLLGSGLISPPAMRLDGPKCYIRPPLPRDWREWADLRAESRAFLEPWEPTWPADTLSRAAFVRRLRRQAQEWRDDEGYSFLVFDHRTDALVGGLNLSNVRRGVAQMATLGYWAGQACARRGYISGGARLALGFAFDQLNLHRVEAACLPRNEASRGLLEKIGFTYEGYARAYLRIDGAWQDHALYAMVQGDHEKAWLA